MAKTKGFHKADVVRGYLIEFPGISKQSLARILTRDQPGLFTSQEAARSAVRLATGTNGDRNRRATSHKELFRTGNCASFPALPTLPDGLRHFDEWKPFALPGPARILDLPDVHIPYHDKNALKLAIDHGVDYDPTHVLLSGDFNDFFSCSFWEKDPRKRNLKNELDTAIEILRYLRRVFPNAKFILKIGNHEERWERYLMVKAPELLGIKDFELSKILRLDDIGCEVVGDKRPIKAGSLYIVHGHEFKFGITSPVNPARGYYMRAKENTVGHHLHQSSAHSETSLAGKVIGCWSTGCLCDLHPDYSPINKWNHGFCTMDIEADGTFEVHNYKIIDGRIFEG